MAYRVLVATRAARDLKRLPPETRPRIEERLTSLSEEPRQGAQKLVGEDSYRVRVGAYRIVFRVDDRAREVLVARIKHRRDVYGRRG